MKKMCIKELLFCVIAAVFFLTAIVSSIKSFNITTTLSVLSGMICLLEADVARLKFKIREIEKNN